MDFWRFWFIYGSPAFAVIICILNSIEILSLVKRLKRRNTNQINHKASSFLLLNLSVSDFCVGLIVILVKILT